LLVKGFKDDINKGIQQQWVAQEGRRKIGNTLSILKTIISRLCALHCFVFWHLATPCLIMRDPLNAKTELNVTMLADHAAAKRNLRRTQASKEDVARDEMPLRRKRTELGNAA
jgi:hypothetical protein